MTWIEPHWSPTITIDAHRPWRGILVERQPCRSFHTYPPRPVDCRQCWTARSYGDANGLFHGGVKRLDLRPKRAARLRSRRQQRKLREFLGVDTAHEKALELFQRVRDRND